MSNISVAQETIKITAERKYSLNGRVIELPDIDYAKVIVISEIFCNFTADFDFDP